MSRNPWINGVLSRRFVELVCVGLNAACTNLNADGTRRHIRAALEAGATSDEILFVLKCASVMSIHSCSLAAPILIEEAQAAGIHPEPLTETKPTPACNAMRTIGQWNTAWDPFFTLDPEWTDEFMATGAGIYKSGVLPAKEIELISIAFDASFTHMFSPGVRRHIRGPSRQGPRLRRSWRFSRSVSPRVSRLATSACRSWRNNWPAALRRAPRRSV